MLLSWVPWAGCSDFGLRDDVHFSSDTHVALAYKQVLGGCLSSCTAQVLAPAELLFLVTWAPQGGMNRAPCRGWAMVRAPIMTYETDRSKVPKTLRDPLLKEDRTW